MWWVEKSPPLLLLVWRARVGGGLVGRVLPFSKGGGQHALIVFPLPTL